ncbi:MAG: hypothetical protein ACYCO3_08025 [Mycobacteriales bacterium]
MRALDECRRPRRFGADKAVLAMSAPRALALAALQLAWDLIQLAWDLILGPARLELLTVEEKPTA